MAKGGDRNIQKMRCEGRTQVSKITVWAGHACWRLLQKAACGM